MFSIKIIRFHFNVTLSYAPVQSMTTKMIYDTDSIVIINGVLIRNKSVNINVMRYNYNYFWKSGIIK